MDSPQHVTTRTNRSKLRIRLRRPHILIGCCGCTGAANFVTLCRTFSEWADVIGIVTRSSLHFTGAQNVPANIKIFNDNNDWGCWKNIGDPVLHVELSKWADIMLIAPLSANTLAKIAGGLCDNLLTCVVRAWDSSNKSIFVAPSMDSSMWDNPWTESHLVILDSYNVNLIRPGNERMPSGEYKTGLMADISFIHTTIWRVLFNASRLDNSEIVVPMESK